jgi:hypothetical protein
MEQKNVSIGEAFCRPLYQEMLDLKIPLSPTYLDNLLGYVRYNRRDDLPFPEILARVVQLGRRPHPVKAVSVLETAFPFDDTQATFVTLKCIYDLQAALAPEDDPYWVDIGTLELIGAMAAKEGHLDLALVVWDYIDLMGFAPTEHVYENTIVAFASSTATYANAFSVMAEMESKGLPVTRALIRSVSTKIRTSNKDLDAALNELRGLRRAGINVSTGMLNCVLSATAERGDIDRMMATLDEFSRYNLELDSESFSFAMETLGKNLLRRKRKSASEEVTNRCLEAAAVYLNLMEENGIEPTRHIVREYVELLCFVGEVKTATRVVLDFLESGGAVHSKTIYRVAMANAKEGDLNMAKKIARYSVQPLPLLRDTIEQQEKLSIEDDLFSASADAGYAPWADSS